MPNFLGRKAKKIRDRLANPEDSSTKFGREFGHRLHDELTADLAQDEQARQLLGSRVLDQIQTVADQNTGLAQACQLLGIEIGKKLPSGQENIFKSLTQAEYSYDEGQRRKQGEELLVAGQATLLGVSEAQLASGTAQDLEQAVTSLRLSRVLPAEWPTWYVDSWVAAIDKLDLNQEANLQALQPLKKELANRLGEPEETAKKAAKAEDLEGISRVFKHCLDAEAELTKRQQEAERQRVQKEYEEKVEAESLRLFKASIEDGQTAAKERLSPRNPNLQTFFRSPYDGSDALTTVYEKSRDFRNFCGDHKGLDGYLDSLAQLAQAGAMRTQVLQILEKNIYTDEGGKQLSTLSAEEKQLACQRRLDRQILGHALGFLQAVFAEELTTKEHYGFGDVALTRIARERTQRIAIKVMEIAGQGQATGLLIEGKGDVTQQLFSQELLAFFNTMGDKQDPGFRRLQEIVSSAMTIADQNIVKKQEAREQALAAEKRQKAEDVSRAKETEARLKTKKDQLQEAGEQMLDNRQKALALGDLAIKLEDVKNLDAYIEVVGRDEERRIEVREDKKSSLEASRQRLRQSLTESESLTASERRPIRDDLARVDIELALISKLEQEIGSLNASRVRKARGSGLFGKPAESYYTQPQMKEATTDNLPSAVKFGSTHETYFGSGNRQATVVLKEYEEQIKDHLAELLPEEEVTDTTPIRQFTERMEQIESKITALERQLTTEISTQENSLTAGVRYIVNDILLTKQIGSLAKFLAVKGLLKKA